MDYIVAVLAGFAFGVFVGPTVTYFFTKKIVAEYKDLLTIARAEINELHEKVDALVEQLKAKL